MNCPKCGKENKDGAQLCEFCESPLTQTSAVGEKVVVRISRFAIGSLICGFLSLILPLLVITLRSSIPIIVGLGVVILAILLGIIGLVHIGLSGGKVTGRGFVVIGIGIPTILISIGVIPALFVRTRCVAFRMTCGTNLSGIGKAMLVYANDYYDKFPRAGDKESTWGTSVVWDAPDRRRAYGITPYSRGGKATISSCLFLLVKYAEVKPKSFVCTSDVGTTEWNLSSEKLPRPDFEFIDAWDFGPEPQKHCSYSYHIPYGRYALTTSDNPNMVVAADRNPWIKSPSTDARDFNTFMLDDWSRKINGNCNSHQLDGQHVLFLDSHESWESRPFCGIAGDNIYTSWNGDDKKRGLPPVLGSQPADKLDSLLVNDPWIVSEKPRSTWWGWRR